MEDVMLKQFALSLAIVGVGMSAAVAQQPELAIRKMEVPGTEFEIIVVTAKSPTEATPSASSQPARVDVYPIGGELAFATGAEVEKMLKEIGASHMPVHAFHVEHNGRAPSQAMDVYMVPNDKAVASLLK
jgi:hypothetical protein